MIAIVFKAWLLLRHVLSTTHNFLHSNFRLVKSDTEIVKLDTEICPRGVHLLLVKMTQQKMVKCKVTRIPSHNQLLEDLVIFH